MFYVGGADFCRAGGSCYQQILLRLLWFGDACCRPGLHPTRVQLCVKRYVQTQIIHMEPNTSFSSEALIDDIETDKKVAINSLARTPYQDYVADPFLLAPSYF